MIQRYRIAFLLSLLVFITLLAIYLNLPPIKQEPKKRDKEVIKIALLSPAIPKKIIPKKSVPKKVEVKKVEIKKVKPKKIITKKPTPKKRVKVPKKIIKKRVHKKKVHAKKVNKKRIIKERVTRKRITPNPPITEPIIEPIIEPLPIVPPIHKVQKAIVEKPKIEESAIKTSSAPKQKVKNDQYKKAFLRNVRSNIIANKKYPKLAKRRHIEGSVKVRFDITQSGEVTNIRFINGKRIFQKSIRKTLQRTFPISIPNRVRSELPINDVSVVLHFNII